MLVIVLNAKDIMVKKIETWYLLLQSFHSSKNLGLKYRILKQNIYPLFIYLSKYLRKKIHKVRSGQICFN